MRSLRVYMLLLAAILFCTALPAQQSKEQPWQWTIKSTPKDVSGIPWARFYWIGAKLGGKQFDKSAMMIPVQVQGSPYYFNFQFDMGADVTMIYGKNAESINKKHPEIELKDPTFIFGDFTAKCSSPVFLRENYGSNVRKFEAIPNAKGENIGTIGADMFRNKVVIIDYPKERFSILDEIPAIYATATMTDFTLERNGRILLPMQLRGQNYKIMFDNGSSIFQLITSTANIDKFSKAGVTETMKIPAWGKMHKVMGRPLKDEFTLAGQTYSDILVYESPIEGTSSEEYDAITGNALFFDKVVIFDLRNKKIGVITPKP